MAEGWVLVAGIAALLLVISIAAVVLRARRVTPAAADAMLGLGPSLVALGIIFGDDPPIGYGLIGAGVIVAVGASVLRRPTARR